MKNYFTLLIISVFIGFSACQKGEDGTAGPQGEQGIKGNDGSTIHSGTGSPATGIGNIGDFYLDKNSAELYGPKTASGWPTPISLKGDAGAAGNPGSKILSGTTAPATNIGNEGDFYFDTANLAFYGPKTSSGWGSAISLKAENTVTTFLYNEQGFDNVTLTYESSYTSYPDGNIITSYRFDANKTINISHEAYSNAYNTGLILIRLKLSNNINSFWNEGTSFVISDNDSQTINGIWIYPGWTENNGYVEENSIHIGGDQYTRTDPNGNDLKNIKFDVKVTCIPAGIVLQMNSKNIDTKNSLAVAKYLGL